VVGPNERATAGDLYHRYVKWAEENGERPKTQKIFGAKAIRARIPTKKSTGGVCAISGMGLEAGLPLKSDG